MNEVYISKMGVISLLIIASLTIMVGTVVAPGLITISLNLGVEEYAPWLITIPSLGVVIFSFFFGKIVEKLGYYDALKIGLFFYGLLGAAGMFIQGSIFVFLDRFLLGGATGIVLVSVNGLITHFFQGEKRLKIIALQAISIELGGVIILAVSGFLSFIAWQYPFFLYLFAWIFLVMLLLFIPKPKNHIINEKTIDENVRIDNSLKRVFLAVLFSMFLFFIAIISLPLYLPKFGFTEDKIGYLLAFISFIAIIAAGIIPKLTKLISENLVVTLAFISYMIAHILFYFSSDNIAFIIAAIFLGFGFGFSIPMLNHMTIEKSNKKSLSKNLSLYAMLIFLGQFLATFSEFFPGDYANIFLIASVFSLIIIILSLITKEKENFDKMNLCKIEKKDS